MIDDRPQSLSGPGPGRVALSVLLLLATASLLSAGIRGLGVDPASLHYSSFQPSASTIGIGLAVYTLLILAALGAQWFVIGAPLAALDTLGSRRRFAAGLAVGIGIALAARATMLLAGSGTWRFLGIVGSAGSFLASVLVSLVLLVLNSLHEELVFRAMPIAALRRRPTTTWIAVVMLSALFSAIHLSPASPSLAAFVTRFSMGIFLSQLFIGNGSLWTIVGVHSGLNLVSWQSSGNSASGAMASASAAGPSGQWVNATVITLVVLAVAVSRRFGPAARG